MKSQERWIREPAVSGRFYPREETKIRDLLASYLPPTPRKKSVRALMAPHAGYIYSGRIAGEAYRRIKVPDKVIVLCPNHTGRGKRISVWSEGAWLTPLGEVPVDKMLAFDVLKAFGEIEGDRDAHEQEHAIEVHVPFLQVLNPSVQIVPVVLGPLNAEACRRYGKALGKLVEKRDDVLLVASTDMSHYLPADEAQLLDEMCLEKVKAVDPAGLYLTVAEHDISMCGFIPTTCTLEAVKTLGIDEGDVLSYGHSGEITGDSSSVVAYASALF